mmetsp:Transcript_26113/g.52456  ORF Transcript_26113/g.52456 Transcript_26113/m.52456 type:complete len:2142 (+) Transcript_26113:88-6513(+)
MMSADDEILQRAQPKGFKSNAGLTPDMSTKKKNISFSLRRVTPDKDESVSSPTTVSSKKLFGGLRGNTSSGNKYGRGRRGVRSIEKEQKMQDEYYEGYDDDDDNMLNHVEEEELDDGELPSLSPLAKGSRFAPLSPPRGRQQPMSQSKNLMVEDSPAALVVASNSGSNRNVTPTSGRDYETLKVAGFWSQLDNGDDDDSDSDDSYNKPNANARAQEEDMPIDEWSQSQSPPRNRAAAAAAAANSNPRTTSPAANSMGLSLVQATSSESTIRTEINNKYDTGDNNGETNANGGADAAAAAGGWNLLEMARCFAADHRLTEQEENDAAEARAQGLDQSYNANARVVSPNNGRDTSFSNGDGTYKSGVTDEEEEDEGILGNICVQLGNICGLGGDDETTSNNKSRAHDIINKRKQRNGQYEDDEDSVFEDLDGQEDVAIELGYVEPDADMANAVSPQKKKKKKGWKSFLGIKKKSPPRKTLVTETTRSGRDPIDGDTTKLSDLEVANTYSGGVGLNPLDGSARSPAAAAAAIGAAAAAGAVAASTVASRNYVDDDDEELESQAAGWDAKRKNMYLRQLASQAKAQQQVASNSSEEEEDGDQQEDTTIDRQDTPETYTADYNNFNPSDKSKFLRFLNGGMSPQDATRAVIQERETVSEEEEDYITDGPGEGPRTRSSRFPDDEEIVSVQSEDPPGFRRGDSGESGELSARDDGELEGLVEELENEPVSQSEMAHDSKNTSPEAYQDRAVIPMVPAIVRTKPKSKAAGEGPEVEDQNGLTPSGIQYYDTVHDDRNDDDADYDDTNLTKKRSHFIGKPRLSKPHLSSSIASSFAAKVASRRFDSAGKSKSKYGKVTENQSSLEEDNNAPPVPMVVLTSAPVAEEKTENREAEPAINEESADVDEVSSSKPNAISFDLLQRNKRKNFSKLESDVEFALPAVSAKSDEEDLPSWAQSASRDTETVTSAFSPPIENMDDEQTEDNVASTGQQGGDDDASTPDDEITTATEYDEDTMSLMGQSFMTGATGYSRRRRRHKGAANTRVASAKEAEIQAGAKSKGWIGSIQEAASKNGQVWHPEKGWVNYSEPDEEHHDNDNHSSIGRLHVPHDVSTKSLPPQAQTEVAGFTSPRSIAGTEFDDQSVVTKLTVNTAAESPSILTTSTAPTRRAGRKPRPTDQRKIAAAHADKPIGWKDSMQNATNGVDNGGFRWDYEKGWIRIDGTSIDDDEASALTESVFYNEGQDVDRSQPPSELLPVTEEDADEFSDDDEDVFNNVDQPRGVNTMGANEQGVSTRTVDYDEKYGMHKVDSGDGSEKENAPTNKVSESPLMTNGSYDREDDVSEEEPVSVQERSNPFLGRIMAAEPEEVPVFSSAIEEEEDFSEEEDVRGEEEDSSAEEATTQERSNPLLGRIMAAQAQPEEVPVFSNVEGEEEESSEEEIIREPSGLQANQFIALADETTEIESRYSRDPSGLRASQFNSDQEDPSGKTSAASSSEIPPPIPLTSKKSLNTWLESSEKATPYSLSDTNASHLQEESADAVKSAEASTKADSFNLESFEDGGDVFASTQVVKEKFSDTESDLFQPFESEIKKATFESFESQGSADNDWVSTTLKRQSPVTTSDEVSQKARVWMDSMQKDGETEESSESGSNEPQVNKADPPQNLDPPSANNIDTRIKKRPANSWIKAKDEDDEERDQKEASSLPPVESNVGSLRSKFESKNKSALVGEEENDVIFQSQAMGIRLKRGEDGFVRVVSVTQSALGSSIDRVGAIEPGDTIKEAAGIDLRSPITNSQWGEAVTQIRHAPRPMTFVVAAGPERKSKEMTSKPVNSSTLPPSQTTGGQSVVEYDLSKTSDGEQVLKSVREYRRHHSPERPGMVSPNRRQYGSPDRINSPYRSDYDSPDRTIYSEASSVYSEDLPTRDSFFNRIAACATAGAAACTPGGAQQRSSDDGEKTQVPMAHLQFLRTNPTITRVTNAAKNRLNCGRPDTIFEEPNGGPSYDLDRSKSGVSWATGGRPRAGTTDSESRGDDQSRASSVRAVPRSTTGDNTAYLETLAMKSAVSSKPFESKREAMSSQPKLRVQSYSSGGGEVGWPEDNQEFTWQKDTIDNVSTISAHSAKKKETARQAEMLAAAKVQAMMEDLDHDEDSECEI